MSKEEKDQQQLPEQPEGERPPQSQRSGADEETRTVSLLDLMAEVEREHEEQARQERARAEQARQQQAQEKQVDLSQDAPSPPAESAAEASEDRAGPDERSSDQPDADQPDADQATPTGPPIPAKLPRAKREPLPPLAPGNDAPAARPPERDDDATRVEPRVAFPGATRLDTEQREPARRPPPPEVRRKVQPEQPQPHRPEATPETPPLPAPEHIRTVALPERPEPAQPRTRRRPRRQSPRAQPRPAPQGRNWGGCLTRLVLVTVLLLLAGAAVGFLGAAAGYVTIASDLPDPDQLLAEASTFETGVIYDRDGNPLYSLTDPNRGNRSYVTLDEISPFLIEATIATEDARFWTNPGFDPIGIARAIVQAAREREVVSGASTITQQLVRATLLEEGERTERTFQRKVREIILAAELYRTYDKAKILELYLNEIFYGNFAYGIEAAAQEYFNKPAAELTLAEASFLAGLPQAPALYDPYTAPEQALARQRDVLTLMQQAGYVTGKEAQEAIDISAPVIRNLTPPRRGRVEHPHFVFTVLQQLENQLGAQSIYGGGWRVFTTLDPEVQTLAEQTIASHRDTVAAAGANNVAMVVIDPDTGEVLGMVGSLDYNNEAIKGQVNMALAPRQPGSSIKPFVYASAMEEGWTPATLIWDVETAFPDGANPEPYVPKNYDDEFHGPLRLRPALGNSYNVPAVKGLEFVGVCDFLDDLRELGIDLEDPQGCAIGDQPRNFGLALALGGGEISPLQMTAAYAALANEGHYLAPTTILRIENSEGEVQAEYAPPPAPAPEERAIAPAIAYLLSHILSDNDARRPEFAPGNLLEFPGYRVAAKTGTSGTSRFDVRDGWTLGYTPEISVGVWVGNTDPVPVAEGMSGYRMATPIWNSFMEAYLSTQEPSDFVPPGNIEAIEICALSGTLPGPACPRTITEYFIAGQPPAESDQDFLLEVPIDLWTGLRANAFCEESIYETVFVNLGINEQSELGVRELAAAREWIEETAAGEAWAERLEIPLPLRLPPEEECEPGTPRPEVIIRSPAEGATVTGEVEIVGSANAPNFSGYIVEYGVSHNPLGWGIVQGLQTEPVGAGLLADWNTDTFAQSDPGPIAIRLTVFGPDNPYTEEEDPVELSYPVPLTLLEPTPTPTPTPTATPSPTSTPTPTPTGTPAPTATPTETPEPIIPTLPPTETPGPDSDRG
ncbi:MAG: transglycosylase domain-containing protein [Candidatus Promineifilaceae bacterium]|nr:transglycosylase domain-containing protein [Candidatus Promineifilaceae bacterium]